ncbi:MAG: nitroreductase family protein [archaeon]|nr:nitroreductase family protein [archaeon]
MHLNKDVEGIRKPNYEIDSIFVNRWSARAMSGEEMSNDELMPLFEAARWAPSASNAQEWRFVFAKRNTSNWKKFFGLLADGNKVWAKNASVLVVVVSRKTMEYKEKPAPTHSFDTGAAWMSLALEGTKRNYVIHAMAGFDYEKAGKVIGLSEKYAVEAMVAIGKKGKKENLPEALLEKEKPSIRKELEEIAFEGKMNKN